jgi:hypothetical protein
MKFLRYEESLIAIAFSCFPERGVSVVHQFTPLLLRLIDGNVANEHPHQLTGNRGRHENTPFADLGKVMAGEGLNNVAYALARTNN